MLNMERITEVLAHIELTQQDKHAGQGWDQGEWGVVYSAPGAEPDLNDNDEVIVDTITGLPLGVGTCGTAFCMAGWAVTLAGIPMNWEQGGREDDGRMRFTTEYTIFGGSVEDVAAELLGLGEDGDWADLFGGGNDLGELYEKVIEYAEHENIDLDEDTLRANVQARVEAILDKTAAGEGVLTG